MYDLSAREIGSLGQGNSWITWCHEFSSLGNGLVHSIDFLVMVIKGALAGLEPKVCLLWVGHCTSEQAYPE